MVYTTQLKQVQIVRKKIKLTSKKGVLQLFSLVLLQQRQKFITTTSGMHQIKTSIGQKHQLAMDNRHSNIAHKNLGITYS